MLIGYMRVSKADGSQTLDLQRDALLAAGIEPGHLYEDLHPYVGEFVWTQENNYFGWRSLLGEEPGSAGVSPYAAAARAADVSGLPPTYISVGGLDLFLEENLTYADRLSRAGVPVELHMYPRAYHGFYRATNARVTRQAEHDTREALRRFLHG
jgi:acetyl esterase/lipase